MKQILLAISLLYFSISHAQSFATLDGTAYKTKLDRIGWGLDFTGGAFIKDKHNNNKSSLTVGAGVGVHVFNGSLPADIYAPLYLQLGYFNRGASISPYINARIGYGFYKGSADFIGKSGAVKGGLYTNVRGGAGFRVTNKFSLTPFVGCSLIMLRKFAGNQTVEQYNAGLANAGLVLFFKGK